MNTKDIDTFLVARKRGKLVLRVLMLAAVGLVGTLLILVALGGSTIVVSKLVWCALGMALVLALYEGQWSVPRGRLLEIIENEINRDPEAIAYLASTRSGVEQVVAADRAKPSSG